MTYQTFLQLLSVMESFDKRDWVAFTESDANAELLLRADGMTVDCAWKYAHDRTVKCLRHMTGMTRKEFSKAYRIPYRTVTDWEREERVPPPYVLDFLAYVVIRSIC